MSQAQQVTHNEQAQCFEITLDGHRAYLEYRPLGDNRLDYCHTFVPEELRGRGVAAVLTRVALEYARERGLEVLPSCNYIETFMRREK